MSTRADAPPHDIRAEQAVLGSMMHSAAAAEQCRQALVPADFYRPAHQHIFEAITDVLRAGVTPDLVTTKEALDKAGVITQAGGPTYLIDCSQAATNPASAPHYARIVRDKAILRRLRESATRILQFTEGTDEDAHGITERAVREMEAVRDAGLGDNVTVQSIAEFLDAEESDDYDWVIPQILERGDRLMLTGMEGAGKSELLRMFAVCCAAGVHPFTWQPMEPQRVMLLDMENSVRHTRRKLRPLVNQARLQKHPVQEQNLWLQCRPEGIDLARDRDQSWLLQQVATVNPSIVLLGPLYKCAPRALQTDDEAAPILAALDMVRARGCAIVMECHAGHALLTGGMRDMRPRGSAALLGWPEFGYGLRWAAEARKGERIVDMVSWRGDRDERQWPAKLASGGVWPWHPYTPPPKADDEPASWVS